MAIPPSDQWQFLPTTRVDAQASGSRHFLKMCKRGHLVPHRTSTGACTTCSRESEARRQAMKRDCTESTEAYDNARAKYVRDWRSRDPEYHREYNRTQRMQVHRMRRARTPPNQSAEEKAAIKTFYRETPKGLVVDHHVPFIHRDRLLAGLHTLANLQRLTARENNSKHGRFDCSYEEAEDLVRRGLAVWAKDVDEATGAIEWSRYPQHQQADEQ